MTPYFKKSTLKKWYMGQKALTKKSCLGECIEAKG